MKMGIVGLPNVGKSTLFNAITKAGAECANYPFCTIEPNVGVVAVPDERLTKLAEIYKPQKVTPAVIEFVDIAGLVKGASHGEGLGNKFLSHIREVDSIVEVVRCFEDSNIVHVDGSINPIRDIETINLELIFADIETVDKRIDNAKKKIKADKKYQEELDVFEKIKQALEAGKLAQTLSFTDEEKAIIKDAFLLTMKPILYVANVSEEQLNDIANDKNVNSVKEYAKEQGAEVISLCVKIEEELASLDEDEEKEMLEALGLEESGLDKVHPNVKIVYNADSSGTLLTQIEEGYECDLFFSAAQKQMDQLEADGLVVEGTRHNVVNNQVVVITLKDSDTAVTGLENLNEAKSIALAGGSVPVGKYTRQALMNLGILDKVDDASTITTEQVSEALGGAEISEQANVSKVLIAVTEGACEVGTTYYSDTYGYEDQIKILQTVSYDLTGNVIYPICRVENKEADDAKKKAADDFLAYVTSDDAKKIFDSYYFDTNVE